MSMINFAYVGLVKPGKYIKASKLSHAVINKQINYFNYMYLQQLVVNNSGSNIEP